jgi:hypothetical protein
MVKWFLLGMAALGVVLFVQERRDNLAEMFGLWLVAAAVVLTIVEVGFRITNRIILHESKMDVRYRAWGDEFGGWKKSIEIDSILSAENTGDSIRIVHQPPGGELDTVEFESPDASRIVFEVDRRRRRVARGHRAQPPHGLARDPAQNASDTIPFP